MYEALAPILNEMKEDISLVKREIKTSENILDSSNNEVSEMKG